jgi:hypothetical protein
MCCAFQAHAAGLFGYEIQDVYANITSNVAEANDLLSQAFEFAQISPFDVVNGIAGTPHATVAINIRTAVLTAATVVASLLIMVEFFRKTVNFEWSSKWENILMFLIKIIVLKQVIQNADVIIGWIYAGFQSINAAAVGHGMDFLPYTGNGISTGAYVPGGVNTYVIHVNGSFFDYFSSNSVFQKGWLNFWMDLGGHLYGTDYNYVISEPAVRMFYPNATFPMNLDLTENISEAFKNPNPEMIFTPLVEIVLLQPFFLIMKAIAVIIFVIAIGRVFELAVYTVFAPLPLATFASDTTHDVAKSFIKSYIAVVLQIAVIAVMFVIYIAVNAYFTNVTNGFAATKFIQLVALITLGLGVIKSGAWAKKVCGLG